MTTNQTIDGVPRRVCHACVTYPRNAYCPVCDPAAQPQGEPVSRALKYLARVLDEDQFKTVEDMLYTEQPEPVAVDVLSTGFYTTESGGGKYAINIGFRSMADMQAADAQLRELLKYR